MEELDLARFNEVRISDRNRLQPVLTAADKIACDYNFSNLYAWGEIYGLRWNIFKGRLLIFSDSDDLMFMPAGSTPPAVDEMVEISDRLAGQGKRGSFVLVDSEYLERNGRILDYFTATVDDANADYVYESSALVELKGRRLHKKKNLLSQFLRNNPGYTCEPLKSGHASECDRLAEKWCEERTCEIIGFAHESSALRRALSRFDELGLSGLRISRGGKLLAFSVFDRQNSVAASVHFEKYDGAVKGSAQAINWETARHLAPMYKYINREQDLGIAGLRRAKESYCPAFKVKTYQLHRKG